MIQPFTASEVRINSARLRTSRYNLDPITPIMLDAFADLLEAREKAVPVYQHRSKNGSMLRWFDCSEETFMAMEHNEHDREHFDRRILYTHPAPADAERLAEALREQSNQMRMVESYVADGAAQPTTMQWADKIITAVGNKIAAHSAQTRPPAASVPDAHWFRARAWLSDESLGYDRWKADMYSLGKGTHESYILVIGEIPALGKHLKECENPLAAQENPNG